LGPYEAFRASRLAPDETPSNRLVKIVALREAIRACPWGNALLGEHGRLVFNRQLYEEMMALRIEANSLILLIKYRKSAYGVPMFADD
jgi:hypothetical protein